MVLRWVEVGALVSTVVEGGRRHKPAPEAGIYVHDGERSTFIPESLLAAVLRSVKPKQRRGKGDDDRA